MNKDYLKKLAQMGFSIIPVREDKRPLGEWKEFQTRPRTEEEISALNSPLYGLVCGISGIEVIDVDLKVFATLKEQQEFWGEYIGLLKDNIDDFEKKFLIKKTKNKGYHIIYRCDNPVGNTKIAKLEGQNEAIIETRGVGGMVVIYEDSFDNKNYHDIQSISDEDREILWACSRVYNYIEPDIKPEKKQSTELLGNKDEEVILAFDDYNSKVDIFDIIGDGFKIISNISKHYVIKRDGATSAHSGYVYKNSGCMYLFSTGTIYPHEKLISPAAAYTYKYHSGNFKAASLDLYNQGYGTRSKKKVDEIQKEVTIVTDLIEEYNINKDALKFPIEIFPEFIQNYIIECNDKLDNNIDYMGSALLWAMSVIVGNSIQIEVKKGWRESPVLWISIVGRAGIGKTPSIDNTLFPLERINSKEIKKYIKDKELFDQYEALSKKEKEDYPEIKKPVKKQFIANDITLEALVDLHQESDNSVGVFKDELAGWLKDMNKYRAGSDLEFWLSTWSGKSVNLNRMTRSGSFIDRPFIPVFGGIQPSIFNSFYTDDNKENGFMDRILLSYPEVNVDKYNENELSESLINGYKETIIYMYDQINLKIVRDEEGDIIPAIATMTSDAKKEWVRIFNEITELQNSDEENEYLKSMYPKQKSYIPRFALLINIMNCFFDENTEALEVTKESVLKAARLSDYFIANAKKIKVDNIEKNGMINTMKKSETNEEKVFSMYKSNKEFNRTKAAELLGLSVQHVRRIVKKIEHSQKKE